MKLFKWILANPLKYPTVSNSPDALPQIGEVMFTPAERQRMTLGESFPNRYHWRLEGQVEVDENRLTMSRSVDGAITWYVPIAGYHD